MTRMEPFHDRQHDDMLHFGERVMGRIVAAVVGFALMITGLAMGVTLALLPLAIPVGLAGLFLFLGALFMRRQSRHA